MLQTINASSLGINPRRATRTKQQDIDTRAESICSRLSNAVNIKVIDNNTEVIDEKSITNSTYTVDYNILNVDAYIRRKLYQESTGEDGRLDEIRTLISNYTALMSTSQTYLERKSTLESITKLEKEISDIKTGGRLTEYTERTKDLIEEYTSLGVGIKQVFLSNESSTEERELDERDEQRIIIIERYLKIAEDYAHINVRRELDQNPYCTTCHTNLKAVIVEASGHQICPVCQSHKWISINNTVFKEHEVASVQKSGYNDRETYRKNFIKYNCMQGEDKLPLGWRDTWDNYYIAQGKPEFVGAYVRSQPITFRRYRGNTDHKMMFKLMQDTGMTLHYNDGNLMAHLHWGWEKPDASHLESLVMQIYDETQEVLDSMSPEERDRSSSLGTQYRIFKTLELLGFDCQRYEFRIAEMQESFEKHERLWRTMCERCANPFIVFIPTQRAF